MCLRETDMRKTTIALALVAAMGAGMVLGVGIRPARAGYGDDGTRIAVATEQIARQTENVAHQTEQVARRLENLQRCVCK
jgi:hypothetical protein